MGAPIIGIDLGTTNSVVAVTDAGGNTRVLADPDGAKVQPSVVAFPPDGKVLVGEAAKQRRVIDPQNTIYSVKRLMGRSSQSPEMAAIRKRVPYRIGEGDNQVPMIRTRAGEFAPSDLSAIILDHMRDIAVRQLGRTVDQSLERAVVTVPANFGEAQRTATATAGAIAGLTVVRVLNEPTAAALAYGHKKRLDRTIAVYDFGGGTFDVSILKLEGDVFQVIGTAGNSLLGGDDIDDILVGGMVQHFLSQNRVDLSTDLQAMSRLQQLAERVKIELSQRMRSVARLPEVAYGPGGRPLDLEVQMTRDQFEEATAALIDRTFPVCQEALSLAQIGVDQVTDVVLVGGSCRIPLVQKRVAEFFRRQPRTDINPDEAVAMGAALQGEIMRVVLDGVRTSFRSDSTIDSDTVTAVNPSVSDGAEPAQPRPPEPPPVPPTRRTMRGTGLSDSRSGAEKPETRQALGRIPLVRADGGIREVAREGAVKQPSASPSSPTLVPDDVDAASASGTIEELLEDTATRDRSPALPAVHDVTPYSLGIATVGGYCEHLIARNARLPVSIVRVFNNARDGQVQVRIRICQGESRKLMENTMIGELVLDGLPARERGQTEIAVTFDIDESGILSVSARDQSTGRERRASLNVLGVQAGARVEEARDRLRGLRS